MTSTPSAFDGIICFGGEDWWYHNRGHIDMQLTRRFARIATTVYVNSIVMQKVRFRRAKGDDIGFTRRLTRKMRSICRGVRQTNAGFLAYSPLSLPVHHIAWLRRINTSVLRSQIVLLERRLGISDPLVWIACPAACDIARGMRKAALVYQRTDRFEEFPNVDKETVRMYDRKMKTAADLTVFVNSHLYESEHDQCKKAIYLDHGVDIDLFGPDQSRDACPQELASIPRPIIGFHGAFGKHTVDVQLIEQIVGLMPRTSFVFVGPETRECQALHSKPNVWMLGQKEYERIPEYVRCFDVAITPWKRNRWIEACNPIRLKEYLAAGKPVVSTPYPELQKYADVVYQATTARQYAERIIEALADDNAERASDRKQKVQDASWDNKARIVLRELFGKGEFLE